MHFQLLSIFSDQISDATGINDCNRRHKITRKGLFTRRKTRRLVATRVQSARISFNSLASSRKNMKMLKMKRDLWQNTQLCKRHSCLMSRLTFQMSTSRFSSSSMSRKPSDRAVATLAVSKCTPCLQTRVGVNETTFIHSSLTDQKSRILGLVEWRFVVVDACGS